MGRPVVPAPGGTVTQTRTFNYNGGVLLQSATNPENGTVSYTYNADNTVATKTDANGKTLTYSYDTLGRLIQVNNGSVILRKLTYDANPDAQGNNYGQNLNGRLARVDYQPTSGNYTAPGNVWTEMYSYHAAGAMLKKKLTFSRNGVYATDPTPGSLEASWTYDMQGQVASVKYPDTFNTVGMTLNYTYDQMGRPYTLTSPTIGTQVNTATYGPAGELLNFNGVNGETRTYNESKQLTGIATPAGSITYNYSATQNNGRISSMTAITGETVTYQYDQLNRLIHAETTDSTWGLDFSYDGFGNRLSQSVSKGSAPVIQQSYNMLTNRLSNGYYDNNGNLGQIAGTTQTYFYDVDNRMTLASTTTGGEYYDYALDNKRIFKQTTDGNIEVYFWAGNQKLATFKVTPALPNAPDPAYVPDQINFVQTSYNVYFGGRALIADGQYAIRDRLGNVVSRYGTSGWTKYAYFPYGEERTSSANNVEKFGTYFRDASTGLDYADQRFYASGLGQFASPDPSSDQWDINDPSGWNMYSYTESDPINFFDPDGLSKCQDGIVVDHGVAKGTLGKLLDGKSDLSLISETIFTESAMSTSTNGAKEMSAIAAVIMNRWQILNGYFWMYDAKGYLLRPSPDMGPARATFAQLLQAPKQFEVWDGNELDSGAQQRLDSALGKDYDSSQCAALFQAVGFASEYLRQQNQHLVYEIDGLVAISFNSNKNSTAPANWQQRIGSFGSGNVFYGIPQEQVHSVPSGPAPLSPRITRKKGEKPTGRHSAP